jgi:hypothetical protein
MYRVARFLPLLPLSSAKFLMVSDFAFAFDSAQRYHTRLPLDSHLLQLEDVWMAEHL